MEAGNDKKTAIIEGETVKKNSLQPMSPQSVSVTPKQLRSQMERDKQIREVINEYIKNNMVAGKDFGSINVQGKASKPSLFKPGAEKFCGLFKIRPSFRKDNETVDMLGNTAGIIAYICDLVDGQGRVVGEGRGTSSVDPKGSDFNINKAVKIAEKRAQIDAVLRTGGLSDFFTQDMEDAPKDQTRSINTTTHNELKASLKQVELIDKLSKERFDTDDDFKEFVKERTDKLSGWSLHEASGLITDLFKLPKLDADTDGEG